MNRVFLPFLFCCICLVTNAQTQIKVEDKTFNFGAKVGLNSSLPIVNSLTIEGVEIDDVFYQYKVGYLAAVFCRINIDRFFIQPSLSWTSFSGDIRFHLPAEIEAQAQAGGSDELNYKIRTIEAPVLVGYKIVKEGPYGLSFMAGPTIKYNYDVHYTSRLYNSPREYVSDNTPWGLNLVCGVGVSIWRLFFDVTYEFGLNGVDSDFKDYSASEVSDSNISIDKRTNMLSFSLGLLF